MTQTVQWQEPWTSGCQLAFGSNSLSGTNHLCDMEAANFISLVLLVVLLIGQGFLCGLYEIAFVKYLVGRRTVKFSFPLLASCLL